MTMKEKAKEVQNYNDLLPSEKIIIKAALQMIVALLQSRYDMYSHAEKEGE